MNLIEINMHDYIAQLIPLSIEHSEEVYGYVADPDFARYFRLTDRGELCMIAAIDGDKIVGYSIGILIDHLHTGEKMGVLDAIYLKKEYRIGLNGIKLLSKCEDALKSQGAKTLLASAKPGTALESILKRHWQLDEVCYTRGL